jgi:glycosyltransferase involved in cell wall biosynthesis
MPAVASDQATRRAASTPSEKRTPGRDRADPRARAGSFGPVALFFAAKGGGVQRGRVTIANALTERGLEVACVLPEATGPFLERLAPEVALVDLGTRQPLSLVLKLARWLRHARPAALIASQQHAIVAALWARRLSGVHVPVTAIQHNTLSELCRQSRRRSVRWLLPRAARLFFPWADQVCAVSHGVALDLAEVTGIPRREIRVLYNPTVTPELVARAKLPSGHPWLDAPDRPVVLGAGTLSAIKDFATLVRAFARVRRTRAARLVILGEGEERPRLEGLAGELGIAADVDLPGFAPNPYAFMARADLFAVSSRVEGMPNTIIEALACSCPVVSTDCPSGPAEILQDGRYGALVPPGDDAALAQAISATLQAAPERDALRARAADFSVERAVAGYLQLLAPQQARKTT